MTNFKFNSELSMRILTRYLKADLAHKTVILNELVQTTGQHRKSLIRSLNKLRLGHGNPHGGSKPKYPMETMSIFYLIWEANDFVCAERLYPQIRDTLRDLRDHGYLNDFNSEGINLVESVPLGTLKLKLHQLPRPVALSSKGKNYGTELKRVIPINTQLGKAILPGFLGIDFVDHNGGDSSGPFARTLSVVDVKVQWHIKRATLGKDSFAVKDVMDYAIPQFPFTIRALHSDNEPALLFSIFQHSQRRTKIAVSRSRPYQKEDNGHVEQKNGDKIRNLVGYKRFDTKEDVDSLNAVYALDDLLQNHFVPSMRLKEKEYNQMGKLLRKTYDNAQTPYQRLLNEKTVSTKTKLAQILLHKKLDRLQLKHERDRLLKRLRVTD